MAAVDLLDLEPEPLARDAALELEREHPVMAAGQHSGRDVGPPLQRPWLSSGVIDWSCHVRACASALTPDGRSW